MTYTITKVPRQALPRPRSDPSTWVWGDIISAVIEQHERADDDEELVAVIPFSKSEITNLSTRFRTLGWRLRSRVIKNDEGERGYALWIERIAR
jgi:hypothetical protein